MIVGCNALMRGICRRMYAAFRQNFVDENFRSIRSIGPRYDPIVACWQVKLCTLEELQIGFLDGFGQDMLSAHPIENIERHAIDHLSEHRRIIRIASVTEREISVHLRRTAAHILLDAAGRHGNGTKKCAKYFQ